MPLATSRQDDWSAAVFRARTSLPNAVYDAVNCLLGDDGFLYRRGGSALWAGSDAGNTLARVFAQFYPALAAPRVTAWGNSNFYAYNGTSPVAVSTSIGSPGRIAAVGGMAISPIGVSRLLMYGGSLKTVGYNIGTATFTNASTTVTGSGTSWLANADAGMVIWRAIASRGAVVKSIDSDTQLTLVSPWAGGTASGSTYSLNPVMDTGTFTLLFQPPSLGAASYVAAVGAGDPKLLLTTGTRAYITSAGYPWSFDKSTYLELPSGSEITGAQGVGDSCLLFTTAGVYRADNLALSAVDTFGNQQWSQELVAGSLQLWGDSGICAWQGSVIVPATDNIYLLSPTGATEPIGAAFHGNGVGPLLRSYVASGYKPGYAAIYESHYVLPVVDGSNNVIDVLVCRLDRPYLLSSRPRIWGYPWTRWAGHAAETAYTVLPPTSSAGPKLLGIASQRVTDLSNAFSPTASNSQDGDGTTSNLTVITQDYATQDGIEQATVMRARAKYVLSSDGTHTAPTLALAVSSDADADSYTTLTDSGLQAGGTAGATSDGSKYSWWRVTRRRDRIRFKLTVSGASASFVLRSLELLIRPTGKR